MRTPRIVIPDCPHHVVHRGNNRRRLFSYPRDYHRMLRDLHEAVHKTHCRVHALCLMANHMHLIVTPPSSSALAVFSKSFAQRYAQYRNAEREGSGKLFEERFWSEPIESVFHLAAATMYIERNPVAGGVKQDAQQYRWSTYRLHAASGITEKSIASLWSPADWYSSLADSPSARAAAYVETFTTYAATALAREQQSFYAAIEGSAQLYTRRLERPNRSCAREENEVSRYGLKL